MSIHREERPPPIDERYRITLRVVVISLGYLVYFLLSDGALMPAIFLGLGVVLVGLPLVDRWTLRRSDRSGLLQVGTTLLGLGLLGAAVLLYLR